MDRDAAIVLLDRLHEAQNRIAETYRGLGEVFDYFRRRRELADRTFTARV